MFKGKCNRRAAEKQRTDAEKNLLPQMEIRCTQMKGGDSSRSRRDTGILPVQMAQKKINFS